MMNEKAKALMDYMSELSEEAYFAGWMANLEYALWNAVINHAKTYGRLELTPEIIHRLKVLSQACGGWIYFDDVTEETWIPLDKWQKMFESNINGMNIV